MKHIIYHYVVTLKVAANNKLSGSYFEQRGVCAHFGTERYFQVASTNSLNWSSSFIPRELENDTLENILLVLFFTLHKEIT